MRTIRDCAALVSFYDVVVVGAGPAGMAAAATSATLGLRTLLLDENAAPGGQIYRAITTTTLRDHTLLGTDFWRGAALVEELEHCQADYAPAATAWHAGSAEEGDGLEVGISVRGVVRIIGAAQIILATGALERPFPIPGWTLPGVMTAGAAQIALKTASLVPSGRTVIAGCGPLVYLLAAQLRAVGAGPVAFLDTTAHANRRLALRELPEFLCSPYWLKGLRLLSRARGGVERIPGVTELQVLGDGKLEEVAYRCGSGALRRIPADMLLLHQGVTPNINLSGAAGCRHDWDEAQLAFVPRLDRWMCSTVANVAIAGDGGGIAGAECAPLRGRLAALGAARRIGKLDPVQCDRLAAPIRDSLARAERGRGFLDALYRPSPNFRVPTSLDTVVCRCEEVVAGRVYEAITLGAPGPNQLKSFLRCGMGPCQGRMCGLTVTEMVAQARGITPDQAGYYRLRSPAKPITLAQLATLPQTQSALRAVDR